MQIRNFSAAGLRAFGRTLASLPGEALFPCVLHRSFAAQSPVERCVCSGPVVLDYASGMSLLVLFGQAEPLFFYLDRIVQLEPGVEFAVAALSETCAVDIHLPSGDALRVVSAEPAAAFQPPASDLRLERLYTFFYQECSSDFYFRGERHEAYELVYVDRGQLHNLVGGRDILLRQHQLTLIDRNEWHTQNSDLPVNFLTVSFRVADDALSMLCGQAFSLSAAELSLLRKMLEENRQERYCCDYVESLLKILLIELLRRARKQLPEAAPQLPATRHAEHQIVDQIVQFVSANAGRRLSLQELADAAHISLPYMHRLFQTHLGLAPGQYIAKIRMEEAKTLLRSGSLSMGAVAREMGFSSQQHFSRQFRSVCGMTPSEYVRSLR